MGSLLALGGSVAVAYLTEKIRKHRTNEISIVGGPEVGKTTLDRYLKTPGVEVETVTERTLRVAKPRRRKVSWSTEIGQTITRTVRNQDVPGQKDYRSAWISTIIKRQSKIVLHLIDHRHVQERSEPNTENQEAFAFVVKCLCNRIFPEDISWRRKRKAKKLKPVIVLAANKFDQWGGNVHQSDELRFRDGTIYQPVYCYKCKEVGGGCGCEDLSYHPIFQPFRAQLQELQGHGISTQLSIISARTGLGVEDMFKSAFQLCDMRD